MTSKTGFEETARYWTKVYAGAKDNVGVGKTAGGEDQIAIAGLEKAHVDQFEALGFPREQVVRLL